MKKMQTTLHCVIPSRLIEYADYNTAFMDLEQGAVDAVAIDIGVAQYQIAQREEGKFVMLQGEDNKSL